MKDNELEAFFSALSPKEYKEVIEVLSTLIDENLQPTQKLKEMCEKATRLNEFSHIPLYDNKHIIELLQHKELGNSS